MQVLIDVFKMDMISIDRRIAIIKQLGELINHEYAANITEGLVEELVAALEELKI